jgi:hypothetical protein
MPKFAALPFLLVLLAAFVEPDHEFAYVLFCCGQDFVENSDFGSYVRIKYGKPSSREFYKWIL